MLDTNWLVQKRDLENKAGLASTTERRFKDPKIPNAKPDPGLDLP